MPEIEVVNEPLFPETESFDEWMVTGRDVDGNRKRFVLHAHGFTNAQLSARDLAYRNWGGYGSRIDSLTNITQQRIAEDEVVAQLESDLQPRKDNS